VVARCATRGELSSPPKAPRQNKREIHYALDYRNDNGAAAVFLVQRSRDASLMAGMWELPEILQPETNVKPAFTVRHSITTTAYTVRVWRHSAPENPGKPIALHRLPKLAITGLTRKILRRAGLMTTSNQRPTRAIL
jgi:A/G-specific adenine glycosylase